MVAGKVLGAVVLVIGAAVEVGVAALTVGRSETCPETADDACA